MMERLLAWIPTMISVIGIAVMGGIGLYQVDQNEADIAKKVDEAIFENNKESSRQARIRLATDLAELKQQTDHQEDEINEIQRQKIQEAGDIKLEILKLQNQQQSDKEAIERQLDTILDLLQRQERSND